MKISLQAPSCEVRQLRAEIERLTADYELKNGAVQTSDIIVRGPVSGSWNGGVVPEKKSRANVANSAINNQVFQRYATAPCLSELASELGISVSAVTKRARRLGLSRDKTTKSKNSPTSIRSAKRAKKTEKLLNAGESIESVAARLDITPRQVRHYRQQIQQVAA